MHFQARQRLSSPALALAATLVMMAIAVLTPARSVGATVTSPGGFGAAGSTADLSFIESPPTVERVSPSEGPAHRREQPKIHIKGTSFTGATAVHFGASSATSFTVDSPTLITAISPGGAPSVVDVTVTTPAGTSPTSPDDLFTFYNNLPPPVIHQIAPEKGPAAGGTSVTILGRDFIEATAVEFGGVSATSFKVDSSECEPTFTKFCAVLTAVAPPESVGRVEVVVKTPSGSSEGRRCGDYPLPPVCHPEPFFTFMHPTITNVSPDSGSVAGGTSVTITGTGFDAGATGTTFKFGSGGNAVAANCASVFTCTVVAPAHTAGTVDVRASVRNVGSRKEYLEHSQTSPADRFTYM